MRKTAWIVLAAAFAACAGPDVAYRPTPQILPANIKRISLRQIVNKTQQYGLEDKLLLRVRDEFLRDGRYPIVPEGGADGAVLITISRYILTPIQYDANLIPTAYKLNILADLEFVDRPTNTVLWAERNLQGVQTYAASTLPGGKTEEQAREAIWDQLARDIATRVVEGFGSVSGESKRRITGEAPSTAPVNPAGSKPQPVIPNPY